MRKIFFVLCAITAIFAASAASAGGRFVFIGDVMAHDAQLEAAKGRDGYEFGYQFARVRPLFDDAFVTANLETVFAGPKSGEGYTGYPMFNTPDQLADALVSSNVRGVTVANNHILDRREAGLARTLDVLDKVGLAWCGAKRKKSDAYEPMIIEHDGVKVAVVSLTYGTNVPPKNGAEASAAVISERNVRDAMARARAASADLIAACLHWGIEYVYEPRKADVRTAELCIAEGADMVIGTHPHVLQPIEVRHVGGKPRVIAWSLGNFISNQRTLPRERSAVLAIDVERRGVGGRAVISRVSIAPTWVSTRRVDGRRRIEAVYAGSGGPFNWAGLPKAEVERAKKIGRTVLDFLGARGAPDDRGFYTLWSADAPDDLPKGTKKAPL